MSQLSLVGNYSLPNNNAYKQFMSDQVLSQYIFYIDLRDVDCEIIFGGSIDRIGFVTKTDISPKSTTLQKTRERLLNIYMSNQFLWAY